MLLERVGEAWRRQAEDQVVRSADARLLIPLRRQTVTPPQYSSPTGEAVGSTDVVLGLGIHLERYDLPRPADARTIIGGRALPARG